MMLFFSENNSSILVKTLTTSVIKIKSYDFDSTPQPLYNTIVGVQSINHVSYTTVLYPNKNV